MRLYPAFLVALICTTTFIYFFGTAEEVITPFQFLQNLTMFSTDFGGKYVDGSYWTLRLEVCFYALVFLMILVGASKHLERFFMMWPIIILVAQFTPLHSLLLLNCYFAYFAAGALFAMRRTRSGWLLNILLVLCYFESLYWSGILTHSFGINNKVMLLAITAFYVFFFLLNYPALLAMKLPAARLAGALTYPLYLIHQAIGYIVIRAFATPENKVAVTFATMAVVLVVAYVLHRIVEVNGTAFSKRVIHAVVIVPISLIENIFRSGKNHNTEKTPV